MNYVMDTAVFTACGNREELEKIYSTLTFKDKKVQYEINKLRNLKRRIPQKSQEFEQRIKDLKTREIVHVTSWVGDDLVIPAGLYTRVQKLVPGGLIEGRKYPDNKKLLRSSNKKLRRPQEIALEIISNMEWPLTCGLIEMATGSGKTRLAEEIIAFYGLPCVFLVPSKNLMRSTAERFKGIFGKYEVGMYGDGKKEVRHITVATYQSVNLAGPEVFKDVKMAIMDECHHVPANTFYNAAIVNLKNAIYRFGLSATPDRPDGADLLIEAACGENLYAYTAPEAIRDGYLASPDFLMYGVQRTAGFHKEWKTENKKRVCKGMKQSDAGAKRADTDTLVAYKNWILGNDYLNDAVAAMAADCAAMGKFVLILVDEKEHGEKLSERLQGVRHEFVHGERNDTEDVIEAYNRRELPILIGTTVIGEGTDTVPVDVMFNLLGNTRPKQAIGRALRSDEGRKPKCLIIDFHFPNCTILNRHSGLREEVYMEYGKVDRENLV